MGATTKIYCGRRDRKGGAVVRVIDNGDSRALRLRTDLWNHSPTGFEWGYAGSGPAQLALAILADALADDALASSLHQKFKWRVTSQFPRNENWQLTQLQIIQIVHELVSVKT